MFTPTHRSRFDGSPVRLVHEAMFTIENEDGYAWEGDPADWLPVDPADPFGYLPGIETNEED